MAHQIFDLMSRDHARLDGLLERFSALQATGDDTSIHALNDFNAGIERHIGWEEDILFPMVRSEIGDDVSAMIEELLVQHRRIKETAGKLYASIGETGKEGTSVTADLRQLLGAHDKMEEEGIYPWIDEFVSENDKMLALSKMI